MDPFSDQYRAFKQVLVEIQDDISSVVSVLTSKSDNGVGFVKTAYAELRRALGEGRLTDAQEVGNLITLVLKAQEGGASDELAENRIHQESLRWLMDGIGSILSQDARTGMQHLENLTSAVYCNESLQWAAWIWVARGAADTGDLTLARKAALKAFSLTDKMDAAAVSANLCVMGEIELLRADYDTALEHLTGAANICEQFEDPRGLAMARLGRARALAAAGRHNDGLEAAFEAAEADPEWVQPQIFIARQAMIAGDLDRASQALDWVAQAEPRHGEVDRELRLLERIRSQEIPAQVAARYLKLLDSLPSEELIVELKEMAQARPEFLALRELLAWNLAKLGQDEEAEAQFDQLSNEDLDPQMQSSVLLGLGCLANRRNANRQPGARVSAAAAARAPSRPSSVPPEELKTPVPDGGVYIRHASDKRAFPSGEVAPVAEGGTGSGRAGSKAVFTGDLTLFAVPDLLEFLKSSRRTGTLVVTSAEGIGAVHMRDGMVTGAASPHCDNVGELLKQAGAISSEQLDHACETQLTEPSDKLFGARLVDLGLVEGEQVKSALVKQIQAAVREMVGWQSGRFAFEPDKRGEGDSPSEIDVVLDTQVVLLEALRQYDEENR